MYRKSYFYCRFLVRVSYLEIYNEEVRDLLGKDQAARLEVSGLRYLLLSFCEDSIIHTFISSKLLLLFVVSESNFT